MTVTSLARQGGRRYGGGLGTTGWLSWFRFGVAAPAPPGGTMLRRLLVGVGL